MCLLDLGSGTFGHLACPQKGLHRNPPLCYGGALLSLYSAAESRVQLTTELAHSVLERIWVKGSYLSQ